MIENNSYQAMPPKEAEFIKGNIYTFWVVGIREASDERKYIYLSDGHRETYTVVPFDYQLEWESSNLPKQMECVVKEVNIWGLPKLTQLRRNVLLECYTEVNGIYPFKVIGEGIDNQSNSLFLILKDPYGIQHRYYPPQDSETYGVGDIFSLIVEGVKEKKDNTDHLILRAIKDSVETIGSVVLPKSAPQKELDNESEIVESSDFGDEGDEIEFKSTIVFPAGSVEPDIDKQMLVIAKTVAGFQNRNGGKLYIGVNDIGNVVGIEGDYQHLNSSKTDTFTYQPNKDGYENKIRSSIKYLLGQVSNSNISLSFQEKRQKNYCVIDIQEVLKPIYLNSSKLYERTGQLTQLLTGDSITWFIEQRMLKRLESERSNQPVKLTPNIELTETINDRVDTNINYASLIENLSAANIKTAAGVNIVNVKSTVNASDLWFYITFYTNGDWSFQSASLASSYSDVEIEYPILKAQKKDPLLMCYQNGCVNIVIPYTIIYPHGKSRRGAKTSGKRYSNGWNIESKIMNLYSAPSTDLLAIYSLDGDEVSWVKLHNITAITEHGNLHLQGNLLVNPRLNAKVTAFKLIKSEYRERLSALVLNDAYKSTKLGYTINDRRFQNLYRLLEAI